MPLDIAPPRQQTTTAELHYLIRTAETPTRYVMEPPPGVAAWNGIDDPHTVLIEDARGRGSEFTLDRNGFTLIKAPTAVRNFYDPAEIKSVYYPEVERLLRDTLGASRVVVFDHNVRNGGRSDLPQPSRRCTTTTPSIRRRDGCATIWEWRPKSCLSTGSASSTSGGRSVGRCWTHRWRFAMRKALLTTT